MQPLNDDLVPLADGRELSWCEFGHPRGRPLLYCHGLPGSRHEAAVLDESARAREIRVLCPERPGYGHTSASGSRRLGDEAEDIRALVQHLDLDRFDVLGFSGGGPHALAIAAAMPEYLGRITLVSSWAPFDRTSLDGMAEGLQQLWSLGQTDFAAFREALTGAVENAGSAWAMMTATAADADRATLESEPARSLYGRALDESTRQGCTGMLEDAEALLQPWPFDPAQIQKPVRMYHGNHDPNAPVVMGRWLARQLPRADYHEWPGATHFAAFTRWSTILDTATK